MGEIDLKLSKKAILLGLCIGLLLSLCMPCNANAQDVEADKGIAVIAGQKLEALYVAFPDLTLTREDIRYREDIATISATIHNTGTVDAINVVVQFYDGDLEAGGVQIGSDQTISSIPAGGTGSAQVIWTATPGTHNIFIRIDPYKSIEEVNENNNQAYKSITLEQEYKQPPIAKFTYSPSNPVVNQMITFDASASSDPDGTITNYRWVFGDGDTGTGKIVTHAYASAGDYNVKLTVTDKEGALDTETKRITVSGKKTIYVDDDFTDDPTKHKWNAIQEGINDANDGDTVLVYNGTYYENVVLDKRLTLIGEEQPTIDAHSAGDAINMTADDCTVKGFSCANAYSLDPGNYAGILVESSNNVIEENTCNNNDMGIVLLTSSENIIANNTARNNENNGIHLEDSNNNRITDNNASNNVNYDGISLFLSNNNEIHNNIANYNHHTGIALLTSDENIIANNTAENNSIGIALLASNNSRITDNEASNNVNYSGISLLISNNNEIRSNRANYNHYHGIELLASSENIIASNNASNNGYINVLFFGLGFGNGISLSLSRNNVLTGNIVSDNYDNGISLSDSSNYNTLTSNTASNNDRRGIRLSHSSNNKMYLNNFMDNTYNAHSYNSSNIWRSASKMSYTYNSKSYKNYLGNYWSDYEGSDADGDGIGDDSYSIDEDKDEYPLMKPWEDYITEEGRVGLLEEPTPSGKNLPPFSSTLTPDMPEPKPAGTAITWTASATDPEGDTLYYRFRINGPAWTTMRDWKSGSTWTWHTTSSDVGDTDISVWIRNGYHKRTSSYDLYEVYWDYTIVS